MTDTTGASMEKDFSNTPPAASQNGSGNGMMNGGGTPLLGKDLDHETAMRQIQRAGSIALTPELFEKIYLTPQNTVKGDLRKTFGNPTPLGSYYFMGGLLMIIGGTLEWVLGNTFPFLVFCGYGGFWLSFASTLTPDIGAYGHYDSTYSAIDPSAGLENAQFAASFAFYLLAMAFLSFMFAICILRTNICLVIVEWGLTVVFSLLAGTFWNLSAGNAAVAGRCLIAAGAMGFVSAAAGWWILFALVFASVDFPIQLPVGDLSHIIKGASEKAAMKKSPEHQV
ncbi:hypothetical protein OEA41_003325 [Lepraria neglecta]|uniref:GPR1/FUN34/YaaH-class plasma membrane protein n=1 Tax=Lepraria neglecta TaxID=209136 RepID=A0AAD9Z4G2_9LECA|nr:hypothetical protein OEA41_003325 [Lepraria neglecta]